MSVAGPYRRDIPLPVVAALVALLVAWSFWTRWRILDATPYPVGIDGYFYAIQLRSLLEDGALQYPTSPLAFWVMLPFAVATDPITGAKLGAAFGGALIAIPAYGVGARLGHSRAAGLLAAVLATTSAGSLYTSLEFVKNGLGLTVAMAALWLVLRACDRPSRGRLAAAGAAIVAAALAHKMAAAIVVGIAAAAALAEAHARGLVAKHRAAIAGAAGGLVLALAALGVAFPQRFPSRANAALVGDVLSSEARWSAPALVRPGFTLEMGHEPLIGAALALAAIAALVLARRLAPVLGSVGPTEDGAPARPARSDGAAPGERAVAWSVIALALAIGLPWLAVDDAQGLGFRLRVAAFVPMSLCAAIAAGRLLARLPHRELLLALVALGLVDRGTQAIAAAQGPAPIQGEIVVHPSLATAVRALAPHIPRGATAIVPERHIAYMVAWYTRAPVSLRPERVPAAERVRILPLRWIELGSPLDDALLEARAQGSLPLPIGGHPRHPNGLVLVPEPTWEWALATLPDDDRAHFSAWPTR